MNRRAGVSVLSAHQWLACDRQSEMTSDEESGYLLDRLPQDAASTAGARRRPDLAAFTNTVDEYARAYEDALLHDDHRGRVRSGWGLIARGIDSLLWVRHQLASRDERRIEDAAGVVEWIGVPTDSVSTLLIILDSLSDRQAADAVAAVLERVVGPEPAEDADPIAEELFAGSFAPFTDTIWFVDAPFTAVVAAATTWLTDLGGRRFVSIDGPLPMLFETLEPWAIPSWKQILVPTRSNWRAIFSQGSDITTHDVLGRELRCRSLRTHHYRVSSVTARPSASATAHPGSGMRTTADAASKPPSSPDGNGTSQDTRSRSRTRVPTRRSGSLIASTSHA